MKLLAIDPGQSGGFAWSDGNGTVECRAMGDTEGDVMDLLRSIRSAGVETIIMEDQAGFGAPGGKVSPGAMFTFGRGFGFILGAAQAMGYSVELVRPQKWQKALSLGTKAAAGGRTAWKNKLKAEAQRRFPNAIVTLAVSDALLLLEYRRSLP